MRRRSIGPFRRDAEPQNDRQLLGGIDVRLRDVNLAPPLVDDRLQAGQECGALDGRELASAVVGAIEE
ncbi:hypothetical protein [Streptomyces sp. NBC_01306]|uniref:hypothetical protein n=1 Tax=Streptomyces sp. NBC_01306 TaxID=2903819 RepID=UPI002B1D8E45|nr:hypothetical protein [Streptomyces sp. NBC_01306]